MCFTNIKFVICDILSKIQLKTVNSTSVFSLSILIVFGSSDESVLLLAM